MDETNNEIKNPHLSCTTIIFSESLCLRTPPSKRRATLPPSSEAVFPATDVPHNYLAEAADFNMDVGFLINGHRLLQTEVDRITSGDTVLPEVVSTIWYH